MADDELTITLVPEGDGPPAEVRIRGALKVLLRRFGLRCRDFRPGGAREVIVIPPPPKRKPLARKTRKPIGG